MTSRSLDLIREEVKNYDARLTISDKSGREASLGLGRTLLELKDAVPHRDFDAEVKALGLGVKKDTRARLMLIATAVAKGHLSEANALGWSQAKVLRQLAGPKSDNSHVRIMEPATESVPVHGDTAVSAAGDDTSQIPDQNEATSTTPPEDPAVGVSSLASELDDAPGLERHGPDEEDVQGAITEPFRDGADVADKGGEADGVGGAANEPTTAELLNWHDVRDLMIAAVSPHAKVSKTGKITILANNDSGILFSQLTRALNATGNANAFCQMMKAMAG